MADLPEYPHDLLPYPLRDGYGLTPVSPLMRTTMESGRAKQRRRYKSTPTQVDVSWQFTQPGQAQLFEAWYAGVLQDGASYFYMKLKTPLGMQPYKCRFVDIYDGPKPVGNFWRYQAVLELWERPIVDPAWAIYYPAAIRYNNVIDMALNSEWPQA
jgi:hypothetical protein